MNIKFALVAVVSSVMFLSSPVWAGDAALGKASFEKLCASCHGLTGAGDGPVGAALPPNMKPADLSLGTYKYATDLAKFKELVTKGGAAVGLNALMPPQANVTDKDLEDLYAYIQALKK